MANLEEKWLSLYIFYKGEADQLLKQVIHPFIEQWTSPWFFIRYWEGGDHIRLRLKAVVCQQDLIVKSFNSEKEMIKSVQIAEYEPEINRYGNIQSMAWAEGYFECASNYILNWIAKKEDNQSAAIQTIKLHLALLYTLKCEKKVLIALCNFFLEGWLPKLYNPTDPKKEQRIFWLNQFEKVFGAKKNQTVQAVNQFWQELNEGIADDNLTEYLSKTAEVIFLYQNAHFEKDRLFQIISSFMHMNNNRLGISNYEEAYLMYNIIECLQFIQESSIRQF